MACVTIRWVTVPSVTVPSFEGFEPSCRDTNGLEISVRSTGLRGNFLR